MLRLCMSSIGLSINICCFPDLCVGYVTHRAIFSPDCRPKVYRGFCAVLLLDKGISSSHWSFPEMEQKFSEVSEVSELSESDKSVKHELGSIERCVSPLNDKYFLPLNSVKTFRKNSIMQTNTSPLHRNA